jgi:acetyl esterase/lipase
MNGSFTCSSRWSVGPLKCYILIGPLIHLSYYWGSINTHRYTIWRYARKMHGRCFAVNYRSELRSPSHQFPWLTCYAEAPQYPFPCAIQDCLSAWLYLVNPPPGSKHKPVHPKNIIIAGDSAGGGLVWALLQILRDTEGLDLPAGGVLISPVSLTFRISTGST